jgi:hypothetical protein
MAYDSARGKTVLFGGANHTDFLGDTWEWDGTGWEHRLPTASPGARDFHVVAYDTSRQRTVLYSGQGPPGVEQLFDTWEWDGSNWTETTPALTPGQCAGATICALVHDSVRRRSVLFYSDGGSSNVWEYHAHGGACTLGSQCDTGICKDGVCCETACTGVCEACDITPGTCTPVTSAVDADTCSGAKACNAAGQCADTKAVGQPCAAPADCASGSCADGVCCDQPCSSLCEACTATKKGSGADGNCGAIGQGSDPDNECTDDGSPACAQNGLCDGKGGARRSCRRAPPRARAGRRGSRRRSCSARPGAQRRDLRDTARSVPA